MPWWTWLAFGIFLLALVAAAVFAAFAFGRLKRLSAAAEGIQARLDEVARSAEEVERRMAHVQERLEEIERHRAVLEGSLARLTRPDPTRSPRRPARPARLGAATSRSDAGRRRRPGDELDAAARGRRGGRGRPRGRAAADDHAARRGRRRARDPPPHRARARPQRARGLPARPGGARRRTHARRRDERRARRGQRRGLSRRDRVELRLRHAAAERGRGGSVDLRRRVRGPQPASGDDGGGRRRRLDGARARRLAPEPRPRLRAPDRAVPAFRPAGAGGARRLPRAHRRGASGRAAHRRMPSASPGRSRRWRRSRSAWPRSSPSSSTDTASTRAGSRRRSSGWRRFPSPRCAGCGACTPTALP